MKSYTDLEQSKTLAEILPIESADMWYSIVDDEPFVCLERHYEYEQIPCWSLAALLSVLPLATLDSSNDHYYRLHCMERYTEWYDNPVDACVEMILKLNELNLL